MLRSGIFLATGALFLIGCAGTGPRVQTGPDALMTPDGLHKVDGVPVGTLFMKPDYAVGSYDEFVLGDTVVAFQQGSRVLESEELAQLVTIFEAVAREATTNTGRKEVAATAPCVALVNLALVDLDLEARSGADSLGAVTLVLEIRDGHTKEALLRYGQRRRLGGLSLTNAFGRYASRFQRDFGRALPEPSPESGALSCQQRASGE